MIRPQQLVNSQVRDVHDHERLRHAREKSTGFPVGQYLQPPPMLFSRDGHNLFLGDMYRGAAAFLVCSGPSLVKHDLTKLQQRGVATLAVNNAATVVRPTLWCSVDDPGNFSEAIWHDPGITKFVPLCHMEKTFMERDGAGQLKPSSLKVGDMPAVFGYRRNEDFVPEQFLVEDTFNWGNHGKRTDSLGNQGSRSVMYVAIRMLHYLGVRTIYLLGCDFKMEQGRQNYAFPQDRSPSSVKGNNESYRVLNNRLKALLPHFAEAGLSIFNCTPESGLTVFPYKSYERAIQEATATIPEAINTEGMYDRQAKEKQKSKEQLQSPKPTPPQSPKEFLQNLPKFTVVVPVHQGELDKLKQSWPTWTKFKPWLAELPLRVMHHPHVSGADIQSIVGSHPDCRVEVLSIESNEKWDWERTKITELPKQVETDWFWMLEPSAIATSGQDWITPSLFTSDQPGKPPVFAACRWGYTKPAQIYELLDDWGDQIESLQNRPRLNWKPSTNSDRLQHDAVSTWSFLVQTNWARAVAKTVNEATPACEHSTFMLYCASRLGEPVKRLPMKQMGWDQSFGWNADQMRQRQSRLLPG